LKRSNSIAQVDDVTDFSLSVACEGKNLKLAE